MAVTANYRKYGSLLGCVEGPIRVRLLREDGPIVISVCDDGGACVHLTIRDDARRTLTEAIRQLTEGEP